MNRRIFAFTVLIAVAVVLSVSSNIKIVRANQDYNIEHASHTIEVMYNGYIFINDTIRIVGNENANPLNSFTMGFPYKYGPYVIQCVAYDSSRLLSVVLNAPFEDFMGFYGVEIKFPQVEISNRSYTFTVGFILSNTLLTVSNTTYTLDIPAYPSFLSTASNVSGKITLPSGATNLKIDKEDGIIQNTTDYTRTNLPPSTQWPSKITFSYSGDKIQLFDIEEFKREIKINELGEIEGADTYYIINKSPKTITYIEIVLPSNAYGLTASDQFGRKMSQPTISDARTTSYKVTLSSALETSRATRFTVKYKLPTSYAAQVETDKFNFSLPLFRNIKCYIKYASLTLTLPEGARIQSLETSLRDSIPGITRGTFQEKATITKKDISLLENIPSECTLQLSYDYNALWASFRPTLWMWALALFGCAIVFVWKRPKPPAAVTVTLPKMPIQPSQVKAFTELYEEKRKVSLEMESLEKMARKGRIPRPRYKVRRKTLETRLGTVSRNLAELRERLKSAGGKYADLIRQLEIAEIELQEAEANIKSVETRYTRGEISLEASRKLSADYNRRKEKAQTTINGILLRFREEIR